MWQAPSSFHFTGEGPATPPLFPGQAVTQALPSPALQPGFLSGTCHPSNANTTLAHIHGPTQSSREVEGTLALGLADMV